MSTQSKPLPRLSHAATLIHPLCQALSRRNNLLDRPHLYPPTSLESKRQHQRNTPIYRSFFKHRLFDKNLLGLIKEYLTHQELLAVCENWNHRVQILDPVSGESVRVICGNSEGSAANQLGYPWGVAVDRQSRLFAAEFDNHRVQVFDADSGELLHTLGESGVAGSDEKHFNSPFGVAVDEAGNIFVCDMGNKRVCVFDASLGFVRSFGQNVLKNPQQVCFNSRSQVLVSDGTLQQVLIFDQDGKVQHRIGTECKRGADNAHFNGPCKIAIDQQDRLFVADCRNHRVQVFDADFKFITSIGSKTTTKEDGKFKYTFSVTVNASSTELFVGDYAGRIQVFSMQPDSNEFVFLRSFGRELNSEPGNFKYPTALCFF